jgi:hypothetical protein
MLVLAAFKAAAPNGFSISYPRIPDGAGLVYRT